MDSKRQPATTITNRTGSSERGRNVAGGRRATKKDMANNEINDSNGTVENKNKEEVNVLRTRSGRTRTTTLPSIATTSRKKASTLTPTKPSSVETAIKVNSDVSLEASQSKEDAVATIAADIQPDKVYSYNTNEWYEYINKFT